MAKDLTFMILVFFSLLLPSRSQQDEFAYIGFNGDGGNNNINISMNGVAEIEPSGILRLTNETSRLIGHAFYPTSLQFKNATSGSAFSFSTAFAFAVVPEYPKLGGHGLAFAITPSKDLKGALPSQYLGLLNANDNGNVTNHVFAVEFDTVQDFEFHDINDNHVGVNINDMTSNASASAADINLKSGDTIQGWVDYDGVKKILNVWISTSSSRPDTPLISFPVDLTPILHDQMFVGFSASTGLLASSHYLMGWSFKMNGAAPSLDLSALPSLPHPKKSHTTFILSTAFSSFVVFVAAAAVGGYLFYKIKNADVIEQWELEYGPHRFSYKELKMATKGFRDRELLGFGGFGKVYRGVLPGSKTEVAVKRVSHESRQGIREFVAEIASIGRLRHRNLVQLQGWCRRRADLLLVYDYMPNGSLDKFLFCDEKAPAQTERRLLSWSQRYRILRGVASALLYLHEEWEHVVLHRDVKASNVLLDGEFNGRLGDFGLAKLYEHGANPSTTRVVGTLGYLAPEMTRTGRATTSSDVFAFGALVLEVVCGRRPIEPKAVPEELVLVDWVWERWAQRNWGDAVDPRLEGVYDMEEVTVAIKVGLMCSHPSPAERPTMREVVRYLDGADAAEVPALPCMPPEGYEGKVGFDDFVHSYPSSSFEKVSASGGEEVVHVAGGEGIASFVYSPLSRVSHGSV
ncbi:L-type lectin-domain containing receptor kinase S.4-like [Typha latifolia]|uniref:L-type lectin-domain containing receptor kinase S.4-like n=1 Tax=Typha latifolia TaxID=4733 RepID=UPI003C2D4143